MTRILLFISLFNLIIIVHLFPATSSAGIPMDSLLSYMENKFNISIVYNKEEIMDQNGKVIFISGLDPDNLEKSNRLNRDFLFKIIQISTGNRFIEPDDNYFVMISKTEALNNAYDDMNKQLAALNNYVIEIGRKIENANDLKVITNLIHEKYNSIMDKLNNIKK